MISRTLLTVDRLATLLTALSIAAIALLGLWWWSGNSPLPERIDLTETSRIVDEPWWPWASATIGILLVLLGLRWLLAHLPRRKVVALALPGTGSDGRLSIDGSRAADAAADAFADTLGVRSARGAIRKDRGQLVARISAVIDPEADLAELAAKSDEVSALLGRVIGRDDLRCAVEMRVRSSRGSSGPALS